jgi:hypothetical protein
MNRSIVIFGKGPSLVRCSRELVDEYDDLVICNYPVLTKEFMELVENHEIKYHFANCGTYDIRYTDDVNNKLKIRNIINTHKNNCRKYHNFIKNKSLFREGIREYYLKYFIENYDFDPSTGIMALQYILDLKQYDKILLVGFDNFKKGEQMYYFKPQDYNNNMKYLLDDKVLKKDGTFNIISGHDPDKTFNYLNNIIDDNKNIEFTMITNLNFEKQYNNLNVI